MFKVKSEVAIGFPVKKSVGDIIDFFPAYFGQLFRGCLPFLDTSISIRYSTISLCLGCQNVSVRHLVIYRFCILLRRRDNVEIHFSKTDQILNEISCPQILFFLNIKNLRPRRGFAHARCIGRICNTYEKINNTDLSISVYKHNQLQYVADDDFHLHIPNIKNVTLIEGSTMDLADLIKGTAFLYTFFAYACTIPRRVYCLPRRSENLIYVWRAVRTTHNHGNTIAEQFVFPTTRFSPKRKRTTVYIHALPRNNTSFRHPRNNMICKIPASQPASFELLLFLSHQYPLQANLEPETILK
ncbi:unnamed protein product, partial [Trichogramma brassicae]